MDWDESPIRNISDTALWTAAYRADESDRADALFHDPYARLLAGERGRECARRVEQPAVRWAVVLRTVVLDELILAAVRQQGCDVVVDLAAGLDTRPYRLDLPADLRWIEIDLPGLVEYKEEALRSVLPCCAVERRSLDLTDRAARKRALSEIGASGSRVLVVTEGLVGYLTSAAVAELAEDLYAQPAITSWLTNLIGAGMASRMQDALDQLEASSSTVTFAPKDGPGFFLPYGWVAGEVRDLLDEATGRDRLPVLDRPPRREGPGTERTAYPPGTVVARLDRARPGSVLHHFAGHRPR